MKVLPIETVAPVRLPYSSNVNREEQVRTCRQREVTIHPSKYW
jgi:hypothetical protein